MASEEKEQKEPLVEVGDVGSGNESESVDETTSTVPDITTFDGPKTPSRNSSPRVIPSRNSSLGPLITSPKIIVTDSEAASEDSLPLLSPHTRLQISHGESLGRDTPVKSIEHNESEDLHIQGTTGIKMKYNEWGALVDSRFIKKSPVSSNASVIEMLRAIKKAYHHKLRSKTGELFIPEGDFVKEGWTMMHAGQRFWTGPLTVWAWNFTSSTMSHSLTTPGITSDRRRVANADKPPRVLELGCGDGHWCFKLKKDHPTWIVHALDDTDHWTCIPRDEVVYRDFMEPRTQTQTQTQSQEQEQDDYFGNVEQPQKDPEFTVRNLNSLLKHERPLERNSYGLVRGREIFDRIRSYKAFIEDLRLILEPGGVIEFAEIDPRPRFDPKSSLSDLDKEKTDQEQKQENKSSIDANHPSGSNIVIDWDANIADRFQDPKDQELLEAKKLAPGWAGRVEKRLQAGTRPYDGVPAARLKSWLQGGGFWDVNETIMRLPVGGGTRTGKLLMEFIQYQATNLEDTVPKLKEALPSIDFGRLSTLGLFLNCHIVTGRNPHEGRMGDLRDDGKRELMTEAKYDSMARFDAEAKSNHWRRATPFRFDLDGRISAMIGNISSLHGGPDHIGPDLTSTGETPDVASPAETASPFGTSSLSARASEA